MFPQKIFEKKCNLVRFDVSLHTILGPPDNSFACYMRPHSGPFLSFLAYYMGAPSDQFLRIEYGGPLRSVSSLIMEASLCLFFHTVWGPSDHFFAYYNGAPRSLSSLTIWGPSDHFLLIQYGGPPQILFFSQNIWGSPQISFSAYYMGLHQVSFCAYYMGPPQISFCTYFLGVPLR